MKIAVEGELPAQYGTKAARGQVLLDMDAAYDLWKELSLIFTKGFEVAKSPAIPPAPSPSVTPLPTIVPPKDWEQQRQDAIDDIVKKLNRQTPLSPPPISPTWIPSYPHRPGDIWCGGSVGINPADPNFTSTAVVDFSKINQNSVNFPLSGLHPFPPKEAK